MVVIVDSRQQRFTVKLPDGCSSNLNKVNRNASSSSPISSIVMIAHKHCRTTNGMNSPPLGQESVVRTTRLPDITIARKTMQRGGRASVAEIRAWVGMWWTDVSHSDDGCMSAAAVYKHGNRLMSCQSYLGTGHMMVIDVRLRAIGLSVDVTIEKITILKSHGAKPAAVLSESQTQFDE
jgi:hypothetical protein